MIFSAIMAGINTLFVLGIGAAMYDGRLRDQGGSQIGAWLLLVLFCLNAVALVY